MDQNQTQNQQTPSMRQNLQQTVGLIQTLCLIFSLPYVVLGRRFGTWGPRYLTGPMCFGLVWPLLFAIFWDPRVPGLGFLLVYVLLMIVLLLIHRVQGIRLRARGYRCHSQFGGELRFQKETGHQGRRNAQAKQILFFGLTFMAVILVSPPLAVLLYLGLFADLIVTAFAEEATNARIRQMEDMRVEHEHLTAIYTEKNLGW